MKIPDRQIPPGPGLAPFAAGNAAKPGRIAPHVSMPSVPEADEARSRQRVESIRAKLRSGQALAPNELEELKARDPELYRVAMQADEERRAHERALRRSTSRGEASRVHQQQLALMAHGHRAEDPERTAIRVGAIQDAYDRFSRSADYAALQD
ncbi:hypothetical protein [Cohnella sp. GCM10027633]|uniref:hypothetical protein n=1 Tax=unclassified Cohnella TaxID=2636738 RepID=UPI003637B4DA